MEEKGFMPQEQCKGALHGDLHATPDRYATDSELVRRPHRATGKPRGRPVSTLQLKKDAAATAFAMLGVSPTGAARYADQFFRRHVRVETDLSLDAVTPKALARASRSVRRHAARVTSMFGVPVSANFELHTIELTSPEQQAGDWDATGALAARWENAARVTQRRLPSSQSKRKKRRTPVPGEHDEFVRASAFLIRDILATKTDALAWRAYAALLVIGWPEQQVLRFIHWRFAMRNLADLHRGILHPCNQRIAETSSALSQFVHAGIFGSVCPSHPDNA